MEGKKFKNGEEPDPVNNLGKDYADGRSKIVNRFDTKMKFWANVLCRSLLKRNELVLLKKLNISKVNGIHNMVPCGSLMELKTKRYQRTILFQMDGRKVEKSRIDKIFWKCKYEKTDSAEVGSSNGLENRGSHLRWWFDAFTIRHLPRGENGRLIHQNLIRGLVH